jgi:Flp pilus assembly protein TadB
MSSSSKSASSGGGVGITTVIQIVFIILKVVGVIKWSWFWVLSPTWISILVVIFALLIFFIIWAVTRASRNKKRGK